MTPHDVTDDVLERWRREARRALPEAEASLLEEIALHVAERWTAIRSSTGSDDAADAAAYRDLDAWRGRTGVLADRTSWWRHSAAGVLIDLAAARRRLAVQPWSTAGAALLLAIAIGANVAVFAISRACCGGHCRTRMPIGS